jgi:hypothetical protein
VIDRPAPWVSRLTVAGLAVLAAAPGLGNGFVYDDVPIILQNPIVHQLASSGKIWSSAYWPAGLLFRPVTSQLFALEWAVGGGHPVGFHAVSLLLMVLVALLFWRLAGRLLPPVPALVAGTLFAVHPVHVEAVANVVGQAELLAALFGMLAVERYITWRAEGTPGAARRIGLAALTLLAILSKETGYVVPLLLAAAEITVVGGGTRRTSPVGQVASVFILQAAAVLSAVLLRISVLGLTPAAGPGLVLRSLAPWERIVEMLAVVPQWVRLLLWPVHLQAEYGPPALTVGGALGPAHLQGVVVLLSSLVLVRWTWRRAPVVAFGLTWTAIAILPVSNLLTVTGVILAERTLFLPSAGALLAVGGVVGMLIGVLDTAGRRAARVAVFAAAALLVIAGAIRSARRQPVWRSEAEFIARLETDAPRTYRAHLVASVYYSWTGNNSEAERAARRGLELYQGDPELYELLGQVLRVQKRCGEAIPVLAEGVRRFPDRTVVRSRLVECRLAVGDSAGALALAVEAVKLGHTEFAQTLRRLHWGGAPGVDPDSFPPRNPPPR